MTDRQAEDSATLAGHFYPSCNDGVTIAQAVCEVCGRAFRQVGRRRYCSDACRQAAWRRRHPIPPPPLPLGGARPAASDGLRPRSFRPQTVYECPSCGARYLGQQRCPDCGLFCRRVGPGGRCPHCDEPVALADLIVEGTG